MERCEGDSAGAGKGFSEDVINDLKSKRCVSSFSDKGMEEFLILL